MPGPQSLVRFGPGCAGRAWLQKMVPEANSSDLIALAPTQCSQSVSAMYMMYAHLHHLNRGCDRNRDILVHYITTDWYIKLSFKINLVCFINFRRTTENVFYDKTQLYLFDQLCAVGKLFLLYVWKTSLFSTPSKHESPIVLFSLYGFSHSINQQPLSPFDIISYLNPYFLFALNLFFFQKK